MLLCKGSYLVFAFRMVHVVTRGRDCLRNSCENEVWPGQVCFPKLGARGIVIWTKRLLWLLLQILCYAFLRGNYQTLEAQIF